jgi:hypothetical protein
MARHAPRATGREVACCHLDDDGNLFVVPVDPVVTVRTLRHEAIHAAQVHADGGEMEAAFKAAAETGRAITEAIGADQADGRHRDLTWMRKAASRADVRTLKLALTIHPFEDTAAVAAELGVQDREAVAASSFAAALLESGYDDWTGDLAREVVAYRFQDADHPALKALFTSARQGFARRAEANQG